jgi:hypothetical protein
LWSRLGGEAGPMLMGVVVDGVAEVLNLAKVKGKAKILLEIDPVLSSQELHGLNDLIQKVES